MVITWLQNSTQKHHRLIFGFLLVVVGVSFVFYTGSGPQAGSLGAGNARYLGVDLADRRAIERFDDALRLSGMPATSERRTYELCVAIARKHLADQLEIPSPSEAEVQDRVRAFFARDGAQGPTAQEWETFVSRLQGELGCGRDEALARLQAVVEDGLRWDKAARLLAGPGHASPAEVRKALEAMDTRWTAKVARLSLATFRPAIADDLAKAKLHLAANAERHRLPGKVTVRVVTFPAPPPKVRAVAEEEIVAHAYNYAEELGIPSGKASEEAVRRKDEIVARILARGAIEEEAARLSDGLLDRFPTTDKRPDDAALEAWLRDGKGVARALPEFAAGAEPDLKGVPAAALRAAAALAEGATWHTEFYASAAGPLVVLVDARAPSRIPGFEEIKDKALGDWRESERLALFLRRAKEVAAALGKAVAAGETLEAAAARLGLAVDAAPTSFVASAPPDSLAGPGLPVETALADAGKGKVTEPVRLADGDFAFLLATAQETPAIDAKDARFQRVLAAVAEQQARTTLLGNPGVLLPNGERLGAAGMGLLDELTTAPGAPVSTER